MNGIEHIIYILDGILDTKRKRHITGGLLLSVSLLFGGLAMTVMTIGNEDTPAANPDEYEEEDYYEQN